jgi:predicted ATPase/transcriptional regulator with XRE-family HTH domain
MAVTESFGDWLKRRRKALDLTQRELAQRVGCAESTLRKIETERLRPSRQIAERLASCLDIPATEQLAFVATARRSPMPATATDPPHGDALSVRTNRHSEGTAVSRFPIPLTPLLGRAQDVAAVTELLHRSEVRLVTLVGPPGVGKTRLAVQVATDVQDAFGDGVHVVPLASIHETDVLLLAIAQGLGIRDTSGNTPIERLRAFLREKQVLLVLDNLEQLALGAAVLTDLLSAAPRLTLLCTSRTVLHLTGEHSYTLRPLDLPDMQRTLSLPDITESPAVALLTARIAAHSPGFVLTPESAGTAVALCRRLDGLPLAIELAAAQARLLSIAELVQVLDQLGPEAPVRLLQSGARDRPGQETLWTAIATSYRLLSTPAQQLFADLAVFEGGCTVDAALAVCHHAENGQTALLATLTELVDASLIQRVVHHVGDTRLTMLETIRAFALSQQAAHRSTAVLRARHLAYYSALAERIGSGVLGVEQRRWLDRLASEQPNIRAALATSLASEQLHVRQDALRMGGSLWWGWWACGYGAEGRMWLERALEGAPGETLAHAHGWYATGALVFFGGDARAAQSRLERALALARSNQDRSTEAHVLIIMAALTALNGDPATGIAMLERSIALFRDSMPVDLWGLGLALMSRRVFTLYAGDYTAARAASAEALQVFQALGQPYGIALALNSLGDIARLENDDAAARDWYRQAVALARASGVASDLPSILHNCAYAALACGELHQAASCLDEALRLQQRAGHLPGMAECLTGCAGLATRLQEPIRAAELFGVVDRLNAGPEGPRWAPEQREYERHLTATRSCLAPAIFTGAWERGRAQQLTTTLAATCDWLQGVRGGGRALMRDQAHPPSQD